MTPFGERVCTLHFKLCSMGVRGKMLRNTKRWLELESTEMHPVRNGVECPKVSPKEGVKQGCVLSSILCVVFMSSWTAPRPDIEELLHKTFFQGVQGSEMGSESVALGGVVPSLRFCRDATLLAREEGQTIALFTKYT